MGHGAISTGRIKVPDHRRHETQQGEPPAIRTPIAHLRVGQIPPLVQQAVHPSKIFGRLRFVQNTDPLSIKLGKKLRRQARADCYRICRRRDQPGPG